ncbi:UDP-N-acetylglucosamine 2-epimerase [Thermococcus kodakarensis KOD1]|uniref:UDP-N-acetylglucosamine 2-epimerase n=1 Tax=Thermococcus kodakarensis (strain ATCC BAA-918 / JCM 12380 / KOD1) TaxID=69014 RepID=Q5JGI2_THEKO|nr:UDP-N-acetylglucosamine 2-epimerase (non-hydrolyzing) [Thermococcus kodakarensis]WCN27238.1 UDP-N-acetylglucosamine 2-epimerase (non-hydrolyzing) [Thermococcus kodakarensis]WCN29524.1 UDP-N-acetylglucosamine 2-epimerase (non-hydrolyzing) [Thermococcus kodakarensis]BAD85419.1 UDP-N-acetylglucosamine 2-epimerase [Thermococcus kodakarensis KOD1]
MKPALVFGTRPEIIKLAPVVRAFLEMGIKPLLIHTGQHYDYEMSRIFLEELELPPIDYHLEVGSGTQAEQTGKAMIKIEKVLMEERPDVTLVQGDTNTVLAGALASVKLKIPVAHVEAGLRSFDRTMPEEINRILADHASEVLFPPTEEARKNLEREGITENVYVVGNTIVDAVLQNSLVAEKKSDVLERLDLKPKEYILITAHRAENTDSWENLTRLVEILESLPMMAVYPIHPRTEGRLKRFGLWERVASIENLILTKPLGYLDFLRLEKNAFAVMTDSGGVQEEAIILDVPCLTLRYNTERPETVKAGGNILVGLERERVLRYLQRLIEDRDFYEKMAKAPNPFGDGKAGEKIAKILVGLYEKGELKVKSSRFI